MLRADCQNHRSARSINVFLVIRVVFHTNASSRLLKPSFCSKHSCFSRDSGQSGEPPVDDLSIYTILLEPPVNDLSVYTRLWEPPLDDLSIYTRLLEPPVDDLSIYTRLLGVGCSAPRPLGSPLRSSAGLDWARLGSLELPNISHIAINRALEYSEVSNIAMNHPLELSDISHIAINRALEYSEVSYIARNRPLELSNISHIAIDRTLERS